MIILALDTTSEFGSLALRSEGQLVAEVSLHSTDGFAHLIFPAIEQILTHAGIRLSEIDCFAAASGPGSFTGVRVGLSAVKGLAEATGKRAIGVSNLQALSSFGNLPLRAVVLDARRGEVYAAVYNARLEPVTPEAVLKFSDWLETLHEPVYQFISPAASLKLDGTRFAAMPFVQAPNNLAAAIAECAENRVPTDPAVLDANYVRRSDAELFWKDA
ncbi:MAG: tRNA (adenosine(37)-N6)-threonylcarbamoyltransferase complex dimerization subunit type 1 TsaB [Acidobacteriaceae bacterium]|nr:tRNA (adenosine(37)-N6)-threonylcarbamoyltransferase complex dimerization subunit type 1 TsaB [Acidobacteriaceae bacterium]